MTVATTAMAMIPRSSASPERNPRVRPGVARLTRIRASVVLLALCALAILGGCDGDGPSPARAGDVGIVKREAEVRVGFERLPDGDRLEVPLFDGATVRAVREQQEKLPDGGITWAGHIEGEPGSSVVLARKGEAVYGTIRTQAGKLYRIRPSTKGRDVQILQELEPAGIPPEGGADEPPEPSLPEAVPYQFCDDPNIIDVLVVYTEDARKGADTGNTGRPDPIEAAVYLAMAEANSAFLRSEIAYRLRLVHLQEVSYVESTDARLDRDRLVDTDDGYLDDVPELRDDHNADVAALIAETLKDPNGNDSCGWSYINNVNDFEEYAYSVVKRGCASTHYSLAHEFGHLMSARHDWVEDDTDDSPYHFNHGHLNTSPTGARVPPWRTIMSYNDSCQQVGSVDCIRIGYFSNPRLTYPPLNGDPLGNVDDDVHPTDNSRTLNATAADVANFRCSTAAAQGEKVWMKDAWLDSGLEPDPNTAGLSMWRSPYIWVRREQDPTRMFEHLHQSPLANSTNWVYVKLHNSDAAPASGDLEVWSTQTSPSAHWPVDWQRVGSVSVDDFAAQSTTVVELPIANGSNGRSLSAGAVGFVHRPHDLPRREARSRECSQQQQHHLEKRRRRRPLPAR